MISLSAFNNKRLAKQLWLCLMLFMWAGILNSTEITHDILIISDSPEQKQHARIISTFTQRLSPTVSVGILNAQQLLTQKPDGNSCLISLGIAAYNAVQKLPNSCVLSLLISESRYKSSSSHFRKRASAIFINQPIHRITQTTNMLLNNSEQAAIVVSSNWKENLQVSEAKNIDLYIKRIKPEDSVVRSFRRASAQADYLIAVPDPDVYNRSNIKNILLTTYKFKVPLIGYSEALSRAGAMISIYTPPELLGIEAAEWILNESPKQASWPKYFQVKINNKVARSLGKTIQLSDDNIDRVWTDE